MRVQLSCPVQSPPLATARGESRAPVRTALRNATHALHERMHRLEPFQAIAEGRLPLDEYRPILHSLLAYHSTIAAGAVGCGLSSLSSATCRLVLLDADLRSLSTPAPQQSFEWLPATPQEALGALYTAEGSMLGGRLIAAQLDYLFGASPQGRRFFVGTVDDGVNWRKLLAELETRCTAPGDLEQAINGALFSFRLFEQCVTAAG